MNPVIYFSLMTVGAIGNGLNAINDHGHGALISAVCVFGIVVGIKTRFWRIPEH